MEHSLLTVRKKFYYKTLHNAPEASNFTNVLGILYAVKSQGT
jgi:hypothetical protein